MCVVSDKQMKMKEVEKLYCTHIKKCQTTPSATCNLFELVEMLPKANRSVTDRQCMKSVSM